MSGLFLSPAGVKINLAVTHPSIHPSMLLPAGDQPAHYFYKIFALFGVTFIWKDPLFGGACVTFRFLAERKDHRVVSERLMAEREGVKKL